MRTDITKINEKTPHQDLTGIDGICRWYVQTV